MGQRRAVLLGLALLLLGVLCLGYAAATRQEAVDAAAARRGPRSEPSTHATPELEGLAAPVAAAVAPIPDPPAPPGAGEVGTVTGLVLDARGAPVAGARVFLLPKGVRGAYGASGLRTTGSNEEGRFELRGTPRGHWLGALAEGSRPQHVDGDALPPGAPAVLRLADGAAVLVRIEDRALAEGRMVSVQVDAEAQGEAPHELPGPGAPWREGSSSALEPDVAEGVLLVASTGPLRVRASCFGFALEPAEVRLPGPGGAAVFRVRRSCRLALRVVDANDRGPLAGVVSAVLRKPGSTTVVNGFSALAPHGETEFADGLLPGAYDLEVGMRGRRAWRLAGVAWKEAGDSREIMVPLEASADLGELALTVVPSPARPDGRVAFDVIALRRTDVLDASWVLASSFERQADGTTYAWADCPPGLHDVLVWRGSPRLVALARGVQVSAARRTAVTLSLAPGIDADLQRELGPPRDLARVELRSAEAGLLPLLEIGPAWCWLREPGEPPTADPWAVLGPYPTTALDVLVQPVEGKPLRLRLTR